MPQTQAQIWYQEEGGNIVDARFNCNDTNGLFEPSDNQFIVSTGVQGLPPMKRPTSFDVIPVSATEGQRIYYRDQDDHIAVLGYHPATSVWQFDGYVLQADVSPRPGAISAAIFGTANITLSFPMGEERVVGISELRQSRWDFSKSSNAVLYRQH
jgi:hypothetical protein